MADHSDGTLLDGITIMGELPPEQVAAVLEELGDHETADQFRQRATAESMEDGAQDLLGFGAPKAWEYTSHKLGFIAQPENGAAGAQPIVAASTLPVDHSLKDAAAQNDLRIDIHLDYLHVEEYPGRGKHDILFTFGAQNQTASGVERVRFSQKYEALNGQAAGVTGWPIFNGLNVGRNGVAFQFFTVNVASEGSEELLGILSADTFQAGLTLLTTAQPVIKPFADIVLGAAHAILARSTRNKPVQKLDMGLDFEPAVFGARLAVGEYIVAQVSDDTAINWDRWAFRPQDGAITRKDAADDTLPFNYVVFRVSRSA